MHNKIGRSCSRNKCNGYMREIKTMHTIHTRNPLNRIVNVGGILSYECSICGLNILPRKSEETLDRIKRHIVKDIEDQPAQKPSLFHALHDVFEPIKKGVVKYHDRIKKQI